MRLAGIICIMLACTGAGMYAAAKLWQEVAAYERLIALTESCAAYIRCQSPELDELLLLLSSQPSLHFQFLKEIGNRLRPDVPPSAVWNSAVRNDASVPAGAREILCSLGEVLGTTDIPGQLSAIALHSTRLSRAAAESRERSARLGKLYRSLGVLGGALLAVLLL